MGAWSCRGSRSTSVPGSSPGWLQLQRQVDVDPLDRGRADRRERRGHRAGKRRARRSSGVSSATSRRRRPSTATSPCARTCATSPGSSMWPTSRSTRRSGPSRSAATRIRSSERSRAESCRGSRSQQRSSAGRAPRARRADRRSRPPPAPRPLEHVPPARRGGEHAAGLNPRDGRGRALDDLILLREGRLVATGSPDELRDRTQADDLEDAFLALAEASRASDHIGHRRTSPSTVAPGPSDTRSRPLRPDAADHALQVRVRRARRDVRPRRAADGQDLPS